MVLEQSVQAVSSGRPGEWRFERILGSVASLLGVDDGPALPLPALPDRFDRVVLILLDAFGWAFVQRHWDHPFIQRLDNEGVIACLATQFPSTTAAHITTVHTGRPVTAHGIYEWNILDPVSGTIIAPLPYVKAEGAELDVDPFAVLPTETRYQRLAGVRSQCFQPSAFSPSTYDSVLLDGATLTPYDTLESGLASLRSALDSPDAPEHLYFYWGDIDFNGHLHGPSSAQFDAQIVRALDALESTFAASSSGTLLLLTADHGQIDVGQDRLDYIDDEWPAVCDLLAEGLRPAGSARDMFLHARSADVVDELISSLSALLGERASVVRARSLFSDIGPELDRRLADVCVLPAPGRMAWMRSAKALERRFLGHHGGLTPDEATTWVGALPL